MKNFRIAVDGTGTTTAAGEIKYLRNILCGKSLQEFYELASHNSGTNNAHLKFIQEGLLDYFLPVNSLSKQKRAMRRAIHKPRDIPSKCFVARLMELNNYLPIFPGYSAAKKILPEDLN